MYPEDVEALLQTAQRKAAEFSTEELLRMALAMLETARNEQRKGNRWLVHNLTLETIRAKVKLTEEHDI
jgi:hypothetical protein